MPGNHECNCDQAKALQKAILEERQQVHEEYRWRMLGLAKLDTELRRKLALKRLELLELRLRNRYREALRCKPRRCKTMGEWTIVLEQRHEQWLSWSAVLELARIGMRGERC